MTASRGNEVKMGISEKGKIRWPNRSQKFLGSRDKALGRVSGHGEVGRFEGPSSFVVSLLMVFWHMRFIPGGEGGMTSAR